MSKQTFFALSLGLGMALMLVGNAHGAGFGPECGPGQSSGTVTHKRIIVLNKVAELETTKHRIGGQPARRHIGRLTPYN